MNALIYFVPIIDVGWINSGAIDPRRNYINEPPPVELCFKECNAIIKLMKDLYSGKFALAVHTGPNSRDEFTEPIFLSLWKELHAEGGEILIHPHEEIGPIEGTKNADENHMTEVIFRQFCRIKSCGLSPVGYRGGLYAYAPFLSSVLDKLGLYIDFSAAPGFHKEDREALWGDSPFSGYYLFNEAEKKSLGYNKRSNILEIPLGADGINTNNENYLYIDYDLSSLDNVKRIWNIIVERSRIAKKPQFIHTLYHTFSMSNPKMIERYKRFTEFALANNGVALSPTEMKKLFDYTQLLSDIEYRKLSL